MGLSTLEWFNHITHVRDRWFMFSPPQSLELSIQLFLAKSQSAGRQGMVFSLPNATPPASVPVKYGCLCHGGAVSGHWKPPGCSQPPRGHYVWFAPDGRAPLRRVSWSSAESEFQKQWQAQLRKDLDSEQMFPSFNKSKSQQVLI